VNTRGTATQWRFAILTADILKTVERFPRKNSSNQRQSQGDGAWIKRKTHFDKKKKMDKSGQTVSFYAHAITLISNTVSPTKRPRIFHQEMVD
jgi:hypothetical protein